MKFLKINHDTIVLAIRIVGIIYFAYSVYKKMNQIISLCNIRPKAEKKSIEIDENLGVIKSLHKYYSPPNTFSPGL